MVVGGKLTPSLPAVSSDDFMHEGRGGTGSEKEKEKEKERELPEMSILDVQVPAVLAVCFLARTLVKWMKCR